MKNSEEEYIKDDSESPSPRDAPRPAVIIGILTLVVLVILGSFIVVYLLAVKGQTSRPVPTLESSNNLFYIETSPSWGSISVDGQMLTHLPVEGIDQPLKLLIGVHQVVWHADPFPPQHCILVVPLNVRTTPCLNGNTVSVPGHQGLTAFLLTFVASTTMLSGFQRTSLFQAAQTTLNTLQSTETVQPGEHFVDLQVSHSIATATQPLQAMLRFQLDTNANSNAPCRSEFIDSLNTCDVQGQNCHLFCGLIGSSSAYTIGQRTIWTVFAALRTTWEYSTLSGQVVVHDQPESPDSAGTEYLISLSIAWTDARWHVTLTPSSSGPACAAANANIPQNTSFQTAGSNPNLSIIWEFIAGSNTAAGCLAKAFLASDVLSTPEPTPKPIAFCLYRFGVFIAVDSAARHYWPNLPVADTYEQSIARHLEALE